MADVPFVSPIPAGLSETRFGLRYHIPEIRTIFEIMDLRRRSGELWGEVTVRCRLEDVKGQLDGDRLRQGNYNFSSVQARSTWGKALAAMVPEKLNSQFEWGNLMERVSQAVLDFDRHGAIHGSVLNGERLGNAGRPWAAWPLLPDHENATLFGPGGAGKTTLVLAIALSMALGRSIIPGVRIDRQYRIVILDWETNERTANDILGTLADTAGVAVPDSIWYEPMDVPLDRGLMKVAAVLDKANADCVMVDSVRMALTTSDQGDAADSITRVYQSLRRINTWGLLIDHVTSDEVRGRKAAIKPYGSVYAVNNARHAIGLHIGNRVDQSSEAFLYCPKSNVGTDKWAMSGTFLRGEGEIYWSFGDLSYPLYADLTSGGTGSITPPEPQYASPGAARKYLELLFSQPEGMSAAAIANAMGLSQITVRGNLNMLARDGLVIGSAGGGRGYERLWRMTETGEAFFARGTDPGMFS